MSTSTVLVVGAGASRSYGYPTGAELRTLLHDMDPLVLRNLARVGQTSLPSEFLREFKRSRASSIDSFLAHRTHFEKVGKVAIASILLNCERQPIPRLAPGDNDEWHEHLINMICQTPWERLDLGWLTIVTFNYDRAIEWAIFDALQAYYGKQPGQVLEKLRALRILHVYGWLGSPYGSEHDGDFLPHGQDPTQAIIDRDDWPQVVGQAACRLKVIPEGRTEDQVLVEVSNAINGAQRIAFLGFSFDPLNLQRLGAKSVFMANGEHKEVWATTLGLTNAEIQRAILRTFDMSPLDMSNLRHRYMDVNCVRLLREMPQLCP